MIMISSSDSEDDCYSNVAQKLEKLKGKYQDDKIESTNLLDDSTDTKDRKNSLERKSEDSVDSIYDVLKEDGVPDIELEKLLRAHSKRVTRSSKRKSMSSSFNLDELSVSREQNVTIDISDSVPGRGSKRKTNKNTTASVVHRSPRGSSRGRGRGRSRRTTNGRGRISSAYPIYSIGNTDEYPDQSEEQTLFSNNITHNDVIQLDNSDILDENEELSVKVYWQSSEIFKFTLRKFQKLTTIFRHFAEKEKVNQDKLLFTYNDQILKPDDTPDSINYNIGKFIDGGIINQDVTKLLKNKNKKGTSGLQIKFQCQNLKKPFELTIQPNDKFSLAMTKCAEHLEKPLNKLKFEFDGDSITGTMTASELELEGGECIDVKIIS
ncbi:unnamed protein product [Parnassius apollo]|uniref:(apollo) hypothetical protein n=1 Tax=Parnassius apollo TaxID=110799 RepID=A0A8S3Y3I3_PARAO|nr:unnamed protein product [Parnassius apollo]